LAGPARSTALAEEPDDEVKWLMRVGFRLVAQNPNRPFTLQELLAEARLSNRAFYRHFETKDELLVAIFRADAQRVRAEIEHRINGAKSPQAALLAWIDHWVAISFEARRSRRLHVLMSRQFVIANGMREAVIESYQPSISLLQATLEEGRQSGLFPTTRPAVDARALQAVTSAIVRARVEGVLASSPEELRRNLLRLAQRLTGSSSGEGTTR
jgi:AcrR family transcriptional regulator